MSILKSIVSVFILLAFSIVIGVSIQAQPQPNRNNTRQVGNMLQRLERSSSRFRNSLNVALVQRSVDQTQPQNDVSTFHLALTSRLSSSGISSLAGLQLRPTLRVFYKRRHPSIAS
jgi:hypothetical protein